MKSKELDIEWKRRMMKYSKTIIISKLRRQLIKSDNMERALAEISKGSGRYNEDKIIHASNTIDNMKRLAYRAINENYIYFAK